MLFTRYRLPNQVAMDSPWRLLREMEERWNRQFAEWFDSTDSITRPEGVRYWSANGSAVLELDLPGRTAQAFEISAHKNVLSIQISSEPEALPEGFELQKSERVSQEPQQIRLPFEVDPGQTEAEYVNGVLRVKLSQPVDQQPMRIAVRNA